jgi:hypothetical protein
MELERFHVQNYPYDHGLPIFGNYLSFQHILDILGLHVLTHYQ